MTDSVRKIQSHLEQMPEDMAGENPVQVKAKGYAADQEAKRIPASRIRSYGLAFEGRRVLIG